jgi:hypothetical protein
MGVPILHDAHTAVIGFPLIDTLRLAYDIEISHVLVPVESAPKSARGSAKVGDCTASFEVPCYLGNSSGKLTATRRRELNLVPLDVKDEPHA